MSSSRMLSVVRQLRRQDHELIAAQARHGILLAQRGLDPARNLARQRVADRVAERVVDGLEVIQVKEQHGALVTATFAAGQGLVQLVEQQAAVRQAGQRVVGGLVFDELRREVLLGDILAHQHEAGELMVLLQNRPCPWTCGYPAAAVATAARDAGRPVRWREPTSGRMSSVLSSAMGPGVPPRSVRAKPSCCIRAAGYSRVPACSMNFADISPARPASGDSSSANSSSQRSRNVGASGMI